MECVVYTCVGSIIPQNQVLQDPVSCVWVWWVEFMGVFGFLCGLGWGGGGGGGGGGMSE